MMHTQQSESTFTGSLVVIDDEADAEEATFTGSVVAIEAHEHDDADDAEISIIEELSESYIVPVEYDSESDLDTVVSGPPEAVAASDDTAPALHVASGEKRGDEITGVLDCVPDDDDVEETLEKDSSPPKPVWHGGPPLQTTPEPAEPEQTTPVYRAPLLRVVEPGSLRPGDRARRTPLPPIPVFEPALAARSRSPRSGRVRLHVAPPRPSPLPPPPRVPTGLSAEARVPRPAPASSSPLSERRADPEHPRLSDYPHARVRAKLPAPTLPPSAPEHDTATLPGRRALASEHVRMQVEPRELPDSRLDARDSVVPVAQNVERRHKPPARFRALSVAAGALCGIALFLIGTLIMQARARAAAAGEAPALIVTVAQVGGFRVAPLEVFVDGNRRCEASPCVIDELKPGFHFVSVVAPGFIAPAPRALRTIEDEPGNVHFDLTPEQQMFTEVAAESIDVSALPAEPVGAPAPTPAAPSAAAAVAALPTLLPAPRPTVQFGYLNLNSIPASNVVVDGRPLGQTPQVSVKLKAGSHSVVFIHPDHGRRAQSVTLAPGARRTVAVKF